MRTGIKNSELRIKNGGAPCFKSSMLSMTLLELLLVMGSIALLAGLLYPAYHRSRQMADSAACLSNLHQIGIAIQTYLNDSNGLMPSLQNRDSTTNTLPAMDTVLLPSNPGSKIYQCPADHAGLFQTTGASYFWNFTVNGQDITRLFSIAGGSDPTQIPLVSDKQGFHPDVKNRVNTLYADGRASKELQFSTSLP